MNKYEEFSKQAQEATRRLLMCDRKKQFASKEEAEKQRGMRAYKCEYCHKWHRASACKYKFRGKLALR